MDELLVPMDRDLCIAAALYMIMLTPAAHASLYSSPAPSYGRWQPGEDRFDHYGQAVIDQFMTDPEMSNPDNYTDLLTHPKCPEDYSIATVAENLGLRTDFFSLSDVEMISSIGWLVEG